MTDRWAAISVPLQTEAVDDVAAALKRLVGLNLAVEERPRPGQDGWAVTARAYVAPGTEQTVVRSKVLRALDMLRVAGDGTVGTASESFVDADTYRTRWRAFYAPLAVGQRLVVVPAWLENPKEYADRIPIFLDSGMAFGTGSHPTTRLALEALEAAVAPGDVVVDVGTGSGVLAVAAAKLGAARVYAFDRDADAGPAARANARRNGVAERMRLTVPSGELRVPEPASLVVANIVAAVHVRLMPVYSGLLAVSGRLILGGILEQRVDDVLDAAQRSGLEPTFRSAADEWRLLAFAPRGGREGAAQGDCR